jgi:hypothetical protein
MSSWIIAKRLALKYLAYKCVIHFFMRTFINATRNFLFLAAWKKSRKQVKVKNSQNSMAQSKQKRVSRFLCGTHPVV